MLYPPYLSASSLMQHHSLLRWLFSVQYRPPFSSLSLSPSLSHIQSRTHKLCLSLPLALRHGFDGSIVTVLGSEHSDEEEEREIATGGRKGGMKEKTDESKGGKQQHWQ